MKALKPFIDELDKLAFGHLSISNRGPDRYFYDIDQALNGKFSQALRSVVPIATLRSAGAFFTGRDLADRVAELVTEQIRNGATIIDPACGAGDLLLACARLLPVDETLSITLDHWGTRLKGWDLYPQFTQAAKARISLLARSRIRNATPPALFRTDFMQGIKVHDGLSPYNSGDRPCCIVMNPPFTQTSAPNNCCWASGLVSKAALFVDRYLLDSAPGTKIVAILPDVLRTGSRYAKWRSFVEKHASIDLVQVVGRFDALTDVDVFLCKLTVCSAPSERQTNPWLPSIGTNTHQDTIGNYFRVSVGSVVPHRNPNTGNVYPYITVRELPPWGKIRADQKSIRYSGTTFRPPFVAVRRNSRSDNQHRAVGTLIVGTENVAVENHLIVLSPKSGLLSDCSQLLARLHASKTTAWLNERIRCRHLTVPSVRDIPWWDQT